jgi:hypothetical protein
VTTKEILNEIRRLLGRHVGSEKELLEELCAESEGWEMRLDELEDDEL